MNLTSITVLLAFCTVLSTANSFFLYSNKKPNENVRASVGHPPFNYNNYNTRDSISYTPWQPYSFDSPLTVALPLALPLQAQVPPNGATLQGMLHNVHLVPCLCPVAKEPESIQPTPQQAQTPQTVSINYPGTTGNANANPQ